MAGLWAVAAIGMRQTNAVWVGLLLSWALLDISRAGEIGSSRAGEIGSSKSSILGSLRYVLHFAVHNISSCLSAWPLGLPLIAFAVFLAVNGGVVVGDKEHHHPVSHYMQIYYFYSWLVISALPVFIGRTMLLFSRAGITRLLIFAALALVAVHRGTLVHPFILADNRHYTFYIWRRILNVHPLARYALIPCHAISATLASFSIHPHRLGPLFPTTLTLCTAITLIPAHLVELRYFTIPFYVHLMTAFRHTTSRQLYLTACAWMFINTITICIFIMQPFSWPDGSTARFMW